ncbi:arsenate reductase/protein-tyrosine-phosphatase family protein [Tessaracoccus antarcticus]|uniref:Phosphotyrosine protein phosphatase I domain-containing protein n=1 Tax=Tessaracoccus antarcticus TaxID=2479848 RepID=A0A3M0G990_9ACTN|nr:hypothetical protein [Tessaracoccus antarcticus]RMB58143.1 hypothetical protein EAX62_13060 [Tessaracoccus antarcticus]
MIQTTIFREANQMTNAVLFVCSMNVCRSPFMQWIFTEGLPESERQHFHSTSRGVNASSGKGICAQSATLMQESEEGRRFANDHLSAPLGPSDLAEPDLIIVATRAERAILARYAPALRTVTFTLREAVLLSASPASPNESAFILKTEQAKGSPLPLQGFPNLLHRRRGTLIHPPARYSRRQRLDPLDVPDAHLGRPSAHGKMLRSLRTETTDLVLSLVRFQGQRSQN